MSSLENAHSLFSLYKVGIFTCFIFFTQLLCIISEY